MVIDCNRIATQIKESIIQKSKHFTQKPRVAAIIVGENPSSISYLKMLEKTFKSVDFEYEIKSFSEQITQKALEVELEKLVQDRSVNGILVQKPLPSHIDEERLLKLIPVTKDIDGFSVENAGKLYLGQDSAPPCTPMAVLRILQNIGENLQGKHVVVIGRSNIVGKPLSMLLLAQNATVTITHSKTIELSKHTTMADIVVPAVGIPRFLKADMVKEGAIVIDVGTNEVDGKLVGDADFENILPKCSYITSVPGGVGPVTNAVLLENVLRNYIEMTQN